jgi:hypothetical protein
MKVDMQTEFLAEEGHCDHFNTFKQRLGGHKIFVSETITTT